MARTSTARWPDDRGAHDGHASQRGARGDREVDAVDADNHTEVRFFQRFSLLRSFGNQVAHPVAAQKIALSISNEVTGG